MSNYRDIAFQSVQDARSQIADDTPTSLRYAALSLRLAIEALVYERAKDYADDLPPEHKKEWQPRRLLKALLEIDPTADQSGDLYVGEQEQPNVPARAMHHVGRNELLDLPTIKKHYDALGSILHVPTIERVSSNKEPDWSKIRNRLEDVLEAIQKVLDSSVWNINFRLTGATECTKCGAPIRRRIKRGEKRRVYCLSEGCSAEYDMYEFGESEVLFEPIQTAVPCPVEGCDATNYFSPADIKVGQRWKCRSCDQEFIFSIGFSKINNLDTDK